MGENTPSHAEMIQWAEEIKGSGYAPEGYLARWADALLVERDARQAAERHADHWERMQANTFARWDAAERRASWWETAAADAAMDRRVLEARVAALEAWITDHGWHLPPAVLGVQSTPTEPPGWYCGNVGCRTIGPHEHEGGAGMGADDE